MARRRIKDTRAIVTGASSGIGRAIALELARQGARVLVTARREQRLVELLDEIASLGGEAFHIAGDVTQSDHRRRLLDAVRQQFGGLDILVNNAGVGGIGPFVEADPGRLRRIMEVNFFAPAEMCRAAVPMLQAGNQPIIVNVASVLGHRGIPKKVEYSASKFALHGFSDALRCELAERGIQVLLVSPSTTESEFFDNVLEDKADLPWRSYGAMPAAVVARKTVRAIRRGKHEVILTLGGKLLVWFDRLSPPLMNRIVEKFA